MMAGLTKPSPVQVNHKAAIVLRPIHTYSAPPRLLMYILPFHRKNATCTKCSAKTQGDTIKKCLYAESQADGRYFNIYDS